MTQISKDKLCYWCYGCELVGESDNFAGVRNCKNFAPAFAEWEEEFRKALLKKGGRQDVNSKSR